MEIKFNIDKDLQKEKAEFWLKKMTDKIRKITQELQSDPQILWGYRKETAYAIEVSKIYLIQVENEKTIIYTQDKTYLFKVDFIRPALTYQLILLKHPEVQF